jgi:hypothetical protein
MLPLDIHWSVRDENAWIPFPFQINLPRAVRLGINTSDAVTHAPTITAHDADFMRSIMSVEMPLMESLSVDATFREPRLQATGSLLGGTCTRLTSLHLAYVLIEAPFTLPSLRSLYLLRCDVSFEDIHHFLDNASCLETFYWNETSRRDSDATRPNAAKLRVVRLPCLTYLSLDDFDDEMMLFLLSVLPNPKTEFSICIGTSYMRDQVMKREGAVDVTISRLQGFWQDRTSFDNLPPLSFTAESFSGSDRPLDDPDEWMHHSYVLSLGKSDLDFHEPTGTQISWRCDRLVLEPIPVLAPVTHLKMPLGGDRIGLSRNLVRVNLYLLTHLEHVVVSEAYDEGTET